MSVLSKSAFDAIYNSSGAGNFPDNTSQLITARTMRQFAKDIEDSVLFISDNYNPDTFYSEFDDILNQGAPPGWSSSTTGAAASATFGGSYGNNNTYHAIGEVSQTTGTTNAGFGFLYRGSALQFGLGNQITFTFRHALQQLSTGGETFTSYLGAGDDTTAADHSNGSYFRYTHSVNSGKWEAVTANGAVRTAIDTGITANTAYHIFSIIIDSATANIKFYIDGVLVATNTTNLTAATTLKFGFKLSKSVGTTAVLQTEDWYQILITRTSSR